MLEQFITEVRQLCTTAGVQTFQAEDLIHTTGNPRANLFWPGSALPSDDHRLPPPPRYCSVFEYRIRIEDTNNGALLHECSLYDPDATPSQIAEWFVRIYRQAAVDFYDGKEPLAPTSASGLIQCLANSKQAWSTDGSGWLNGEDGTAIFLPGLIGAAVSAPSKAAVPIKHFTVKYGATTVYNMSGDCIVQAVDEKTARWEVENQRAFDDLAWDLVPHHELVSHLDKGSFNVLEVNEVPNDY